MKAFFSLILMILSFSSSFAKTTYNLSFDELDNNLEPIDWDLGFKKGGAKGYILELDSINVKDGKYSLSITNNPNSKNRTFGACSYMIPAIFAGDTVELKGFMKTENITDEGFGGLWMRVDGDAGALAFNNMQDKKITGTNGWQEYTIRLPLDEQASKLFIGGLLVGTGTVWFDNFKLRIDGKEIENAPKKKIKIYKAQMDSAFYDGSKIRFSSVNDDQIKNISILAKVWGFLKYYHPSVAEGNFNWDFELFRILPKIMSAKNKTNRDRYLLKWIESLGPVSICDTCKTKINGDYKQVPDLVWINNGIVDEQLKSKLDFIYKNRNQKNNYYISLTPWVKNPIFKNENPYEGFDYPDTGYRLLALFRYWNIIQYFSPYKYIIDENWHTVLDQAIPNFITAKNPLEYRLECLKLIGKTSDTHANIWGQDSILSNYYGLYYPSVQVKFIEEKLVVTGFYNEYLGKKDGFQIGDIVEEITDKEVDKLLKEKLPFYPASNYSIKLRNIGRNILRGNKKRVKLKVKRNGNSLFKTLNRYPVDSLNLQIDRAHNKPDSCYRLISKDIGYIYLGNIKSAKIDTIFKKFKATKGIIIDIRNYPSEFVVFSMGKHLVPKPTEFAKFTYGNINHPGLFSWTPAIKIGKENPDYYKGKVVILINEITQSQAEYTTMAFSTAPKAIVIGSTTAAADGNVSTFYLPGNIRTMITGIGVYYPNGKATQRIGIIPDIKVKPTIKGISEGRDELLERAVNIINN
ncbi:MAG: peptidase S41 [Calditrichaeota bacterium]|nr:MAG: peptidase S41 [Calditrichota bacterium]MBL1207410.1 peptidase S41 [Calditrichota bacterium]NOG47242.1 peptidase S41 [Calditrichota bacterium]